MADGRALTIPNVHRHDHAVSRNYGGQDLPGQGRFGGAFRQVTTVNPHGPGVTHSSEELMDHLKEQTYVLEPNVDKAETASPFPLGAKKRMNQRTNNQIFTG